MLVSVRLGFLAVPNPAIKLSCIELIEVECSQRGFHLRKEEVRRLMPDEKRPSIVEESQ